MKVGQVWKDRSGNLETIAEIYGEGFYPVRDADGVQYTATGKYVDDKTTHAFDLVELVSEPEEIQSYAHAVEVLCTQAAEARVANQFGQRSTTEPDKHAIAAETLEALGWTWDGHCWTESAVQTTAESALATQVGGNHYKSLPIQPVEYCHRNGLGFCESSVVKYVSRWKAKNGIKDLEKAKHFIELLIQLETEK